MRVTATKLRANLFKLLDRVIKQGEVIEIERGGQLLRLSLAKPANKLANLVARPNFVKGDPDDLVHMDWSNEWKP